MTTGLLERKVESAPKTSIETDHVFLKAAVIKAIDENCGRYTPQIIADMGRLPHGMRNEIVEYVRGTYLSGMSAEASMHNTRLIVDMLQSRIADRKARRNPDYSN